VKLGKHNVAMAVNDTGHRLFVASRSGDISIFDTSTGKELSSFPIGKGVDDLAFDSTSKRLYAPCRGDGLIYVYEQRSQDSLTLIGKVPSGLGGKNGLLDKPLGRYFVMVPPQGSIPGAIFPNGTLVG
jgi:DNA-binding beta-propeller fold protein YncE